MSNAANWDGTLRNVPVKTGLEIDGLIFTKLFKPYRVVIEERTYVDIHYKKIIVRLHMEHLLQENMIESKIGVNWFMVNQELADRDDIALLKYVALVIVKTKYAEILMHLLRENRGYDFEVFNLSFTSISKPLKFKKRYDEFLHVAGASWMKNTGTILKAWSKHPEWPKLTVLCREYCFDEFREEIKLAKKCKNIVLYTTALPFPEVVKLQGEIGIQLVCSKQEGWGHYIHEAKSQEACCIYTRGPPMGEFFEDGVDGVGVVRGRKVKSDGDIPGSYGWNITVTELTKAVKRVLRMTLVERCEMGVRARENFFISREEFLRRGDVLVSEILPKV